VGSDFIAGNFPDNRIFSTGEAYDLPSPERIAGNITARLIIRPVMQGKGCQRDEYSRNTPLTTQISTSSGWFSIQQRVSSIT
jgi:hypothetical protein